METIGALFVLTFCIGIVQRLRAQDREIARLRARVSAQAQFIEWQEKRLIEAGQGRTNGVEQ